MQTKYALTVREDTPLLKAFRNAGALQAQVVEEPEPFEAALVRNHTQAVAAQDSTAERIERVRDTIAILTGNIVADLVETRLRNDDALSRLNPENPAHQDTIHTAVQVMEAQADAYLKLLEAAGEYLTNQAGGDIRDNGEGDATNPNDPLFGATVFPSSLPQLHPVRDKNGNTTYKVVGRFRYE
jgi:hypothetical protein